VAGVKSVEIEVDGARDLALISSDDSVWLVIPHRWWDLSTLIWWLFCPADKKARVKLRTTNEEHVSFWAARVATRHVRLKGSVK
jgi:hypothetical protein